jgi:hypothetical protein
MIEAIDDFIFRDSCRGHRPLRDSRCSLRLVYDRLLSSVPHAARHVLLNQGPAPS